MDPGAVSAVMNRTVQFLYRLIMIGDNNVGKSCMLKRCIEGLYQESINVTIGMSFFSRILEVEPGVKVNQQIWDTPGHESFWRIICPFIRHSAGCLLVFDLGNYNSFTYIKHRHMEVCNIVQPYTVLFMLVGHKCDRNEREVNQDEVEKFASELGAPYIEASAKTGHNVAEAFELLTRRIYRGYLSGKCACMRAVERSIKNKSVENNKCCDS